jgi:integrase
MITRLTDAKVRALEVPAAGNRVHYDGDVKGFGARITAGGARSFILNYRAGGRERRLTIGSFPDWSVAAAREQAKSLKRRIDVGQDPMAERHAERTAPTVAAMAERYLKEHTGKLSPRSIVENQSLLRQLILPAMGKLRAETVCRSDVEAFHRSVATKTRANRAHSLLRRMFNLAIAWEWVATNPCIGVERNHEDKRERYLTPAELERLMGALAKCPNQPSANVIRLLLLTGARRGEVLSATWDQFDLGAGVWVKPAATTKQRRLHRVPLSAPARQLLAEMQAASDGGIALFPGRGGSEHQTDLKRFWASVCKAAKISGVRVHDLRHSYASYLASAGLSLPVIGALLGHSSPATTARYSHLLDDPLRAATERVGAIVAGATKKAGEVVPMRRGGAGA